MAMALRPRPRASSINSRYGSQALAVGARLPGAGDPAETSARAGGAGPGSVDTSMAGFAGGCPRGVGKEVVCDRLSPVVIGHRVSTEPNDVSRDALDHAWQWFALHAQHRMQSFTHKGLRSNSTLRRKRRPQVRRVGRDFAHALRQSGVALRDGCRRGT
jgi:hypothetical protein